MTAPPATPGRQESVRQIAAWLVSQLPGLSSERAQALVGQATRRQPGILLEYVRGHPSALTNPAPLLIRRSQRLMSKNFIDIIRDLVPDGLNQIEKLAGTSGS